MIPQEVRLKVIQLASEGKVQRDIARNLGISIGSVCGILKASRQQKCSSSNLSEELEPRPQPQPTINDSTISTAVDIGYEQPTSSSKSTDMNKTGSSSSAAKTHSGEELTNIPTSEISKSEDSVNVDTRTSEPNIDFADIAYLENYPNPNIDMSYIQNQEVEDMQDADNTYLDSDVYTDLYANYDERYDGDRQFGYYLSVILTNMGIHANFVTS